MRFGPAQLTFLFLAFLLVPAGGALAVVVHGDYLDSRVDFLDVQETTQQGVNPALWGTITAAPSLPTERTLDPSLNSFTVTGGGGGDVKQSVLEFGIVSHLPYVVDEVLIEETVVTTGGSGLGTFSGTATVTADIDGPIAPVVIPFVGSFIGSAGTASVDIASNVPDATEIDFALSNRVEAFGGGASASKDAADITVFLPEPGVNLALPLGSVFVSWLARRRPAAS